MLKRIKYLFTRKKQPVSIPIDRMGMLVDMLARTEPGEISCDDVGAALAEFAEMHQQGEDVLHLMPLVHQHLEMCRACREEYEALMAALKAETQFSYSDLH